MGRAFTKQHARGALSAEAAAAGMLTGARHCCSCLQTQRARRAWISLSIDMVMLLTTMLGWRDQVNGKDCAIWEKLVRQREVSVLAMRHVWLPLLSHATINKTSLPRSTEGLQMRNLFWRVLEKSSLVAHQGQSTGKAGFMEGRDASPLAASCQALICPRQYLPVQLGVRDVSALGRDGLHSQMNTDHMPTTAHHRTGSAACQPIAKAQLITCHQFHSARQDHAACQPSTTKGVPFEGNSPSMAMATLPSACMLQTCSGSSVYHSARMALYGMLCTWSRPRML